MPRPWCVPSPRPTNSWRRGPKLRPRSSWHGSASRPACLARAPRRSPAAWMRPTSGWASGRRRRPPRSRPGYPRWPTPSAARPTTSCGPSTTSTAGWRARAEETSKLIMARAVEATGQIVAKAPTTSFATFEDADDRLTAGSATPPSHRRPRNRPCQRVRRDRSPDRHPRRRERRNAWRPLGGDRRRVQRSRAEDHLARRPILPASSTRPSSRSSPARIRRSAELAERAQAIEHALAAADQRWSEAPNPLAQRVAGQVGEVERRLSANSADRWPRRSTSRSREAEAQLCWRANVIAETFAAVGEHIGKSTNDAAKTIGVNTRELNAMLAAAFRRDHQDPRRDGKAAGRPLRRERRRVAEEPGGGHAAGDRTAAHGERHAGQRARQPHRRDACRGRRRAHDAFRQRRRPDRPPFRVELAARRAHRAGRARTCSASTSSCRARPTSSPRPPRRQRRPSPARRGLSTPTPTA